MSDNDGLSDSEIIKLLFKNYMNFTTTSHNKLFYQETLLSNNNNIFSSGVLTNSPPVDTPNFNGNEVKTASELSEYLSYAALPNINIDEDWFNSKRTIGHTDSSGVFSVDSTDDAERTVLRLETIKLDYLGGTSAAFVCNDNSGVNILQNLVPPNYATNGYSTRLWYLNNNNILAEIGWLTSRNTLGTSTYVGHDVSFGGALFDSKNGVVTFYDVLNDDPGAVFSEISCNFYLTATKYIGSTLADGGVGSGPVNTAGQTFHEVVTGAPQTFTMGDISNTIFTIDISWSFEDIQPSESNNSLFNFPLPNKRDRVIPYMSHIYFDISSSGSDTVFDASIEIHADHNYAEDNKEVSGNINVGGNDLSYNLTYRTLTLTKFSEDTRTYTVNVWGVNESNESDVYKLPFVDISFVPDSVVEPKSIDLIADYATGTISGDLLNDYSINDSDGVIVRFKIDNSGSFFGTFIWDDPLDSHHDGVDDSYANYYSSDGKWTFSPDGTTGNTTITIRIWTDFDTKVGGQGISAEFYSDSDVSGFSSTIDINIFVDAEAIFDPTSDTSGISQEGEVVAGIVYANDSDGAITFSISGGEEYPDGSGLWQYHTGDGSANIVAFSDLSAAWEYTPDSDFSGNDIFYIRTTDTSGGISEQIINIFVDKEADFTDPNNSDTSGISQTDGEDVSGIVYATDADGDISFSIVGGGDSTNSWAFYTGYGTATIDSYSDNSAVWLYNPDTDFSGNDTFTIRTTDASGGTSDISINIFVDKEADFTDPNNSDTSGISQTDGEDVSGIVYATDADGDISFSIVGGDSTDSWTLDTGYGTATIVSQSDISAIWYYEPDSNFTGHDSFTIRTTDTSGGTTDISINVYVDMEAEFTGDLSKNTNVGEDTSGVVYIHDPNANITYNISNDISYGDLSYSSIPSNADSSPASDISINWIYTADSRFTGEESFTIITTDINGGTTSQQILIAIPYIYEINDHGSLDTSMLSVHDDLIAVGTSISVKSNSNRYDLSGNENNSGYQFDIYKVDETEISVEYLPSNMTDEGLAGINLSSIMKNKVFKDYSGGSGDDLSYVENEFYNSLSESTYDDDIIVYIVATNKSTGEHFMGRINKDLPGFDEMNPWYLTNKVNSDSTLHELSSGLGSGALPSSELQTDISNNSISSYFDTTQINGHDPIIIHINSNAFENHYFYFATKLQ